MDVRTTTKAIWSKFHIHSGDNLPLEGWYQSVRETIYELWGELEFKIGAEIGVRMGKNSEAMFNRIPELKLYCVDPWGAYLKITDETQEKYYKYAKSRLSKYDAVLIKKISMDAVGDFEDDSLDFVYIDGRHDGDYVLEDIICWTPKVKKGGIVAGHDFYAFYQAGVMQAVEAYTMANNIKQWYTTREKAPSFFWVKE